MHKKRGTSGRSRTDPPSLQPCPATGLRRLPTVGPSVASSESVNHVSTRTCFGLREVELFVCLHTVNSATEVQK